MTFSDIETTFDIDVTPEILFDIANKLEHHSKNVYPGQVVKVKLKNSNICFIYKPMVKTGTNTTAMDSETKR
jgi:hypothetical protein